MRQDNKIIRSNRMQTILSTARSAYRRKGLLYILSTGTRMLLDWPTNSLQLWYYKRFKSSETFEFNGNAYHYLYHSYCTSWKNERSVVIPIIWSIVRSGYEQKNRILEVGNVLSYVFDVGHDVLDKYEDKSGIINEDVTTFNPSYQYDLIVSIFTLHLVGLYDEPNADPYRGLQAFENLRRILAPGGQMVIATPLGENTALDDFFKSNSLQFTNQYFFKGNSKSGWKQVGSKDIGSNGSHNQSAFILSIYDKK
jgi:hypothetical protein